MGRFTDERLFLGGIGFGIHWQAKPMINRRTGDSVDALDADSVDGEDLSRDTPPHMFGQSSMGKVPATSTVGSAR